MTQSLRYGQLTTFTTSLLTCPTSQSDILPVLSPPSTDWHIAHLWQSFCPPRAQSDILPSFGMQSFFSGFLLCPTTNPLSTESMVKVQATPLLQYVPPDVDPPASYVCNPSQNGQTVTELDRNLIHGRISFFNKCCWHPQFTWETTFYGGDRIGPEFGDGLIKVRADFDNCYDISPGYKVWLKQYVWWHWWRMCLCLCIFSFFRRNIW